MGRTSQLVFRISKFILPFLEILYRNYILTDLKAIPEDLENYVLKPFSFPEQELFFTKEDIEAVVEKLYILQKKVNYIPIVQS
jgi:hypothetical protein